MRGALERLLQLHTCLVYAFMYAPILLMGLFSLNSARYMTFPLEDFTFAWYVQVLSDTRILGADNQAIRATAHGDEHPPVGLRLAWCLLTLEADGNTARPGFHRRDTRTQHHRLVARLDTLLQWPDQVSITRRDQRLGHLDDRDADAQGFLNRCHLQPNNSATDDE